MTVAAGLVGLGDLDPATYRPHPLHAADRTYPETNCYTDLFVELLHARGDEPLAALGSTVAVDFEGDQFTFFKPDPADLRALFGVDVHEMQPYRPLPLQAEQLLAAGCGMTVEVDGWFLPDTCATSYRRTHVKTTIALQAVDLGAQVLRYFHNGGLFELSGEDFPGALATRPGGLPPYAEIVRFDAGPRLEGEALREAARPLLHRHLSRRPLDPFGALSARLEQDLPQLLAADEAEYHAHAFATVRMAGAASGTAAACARYLYGGRAEGCAQRMDRVAQVCKVVGFRLARRRPFDLAALLSPAAVDWRDALAGLDELRG